MRVSFIGMSNIGKTYWARRVAAEQGIEHINCDSLIEKQLGPELQHLGYRGLKDVAKWMGQPPDPKYQANSAQYIACEKTVMRTLLDNLSSTPSLDAVVDTTGSVIYTGDEIVESLNELTPIVYFEASDAHIENLFRRYLNYPKPVIWGDTYKPLPEEQPRQTLKRCYLELLHERIRLYSKIATVTVPFEQHRDRTTDMVALLKRLLPPK